MDEVALDSSGLSPEEAVVANRRTALAGPITSFALAVLMLQLSFTRWSSQFGEPWRLVVVGYVSAVIGLLSLISHGYGLNDGFITEV